MNVSAKVLGALLVCSTLSACGSASLSRPQGDGASSPQARLRVSGACPCLYVANRSKPDRITIYGSGKRRAPIREITGPRTGLAGAWGIAVDSVGQIYVANSSANTITVYAAAAHGNAFPVTTIGGPYTGLNEPAGIELDAADNIYVANYGNNSVEVFAAGAYGNVPASQTIAGSYTNLETPTDVALDAADDLYVTNSHASTITVYAPGAGGNTAPIAQLGGTATKLNSPSSVILDGNGNIFVSNSGAQGPPYSVNVFAPGSNGDVAPIAYISGSATKLNVPFGIALDAVGSIYTGNYGSNSVTTYASGATGNVRPSSILQGKKSKVLLPVGLSIR